MRWPWKRHEPRRRTRSTEGTRAREKAAADLAQTEARWPEVRDVAKSLRELRERNHFGESVAHLFQGGRK